MRADAPSPPMPAGGARCWNCTSPLAGDQRYCLACGTAVVDVAHLLAPAPLPLRPPEPPPPARLQLPVGVRGATAALTGALAVGVLAGIAGSPAAFDRALAAPRVVVMAPAAAGDPAALASVAPVAGLDALQAAAAAPAGEARTVVAANTASDTAVEPVTPTEASTSDPAPAQPKAKTTPAATGDATDPAPAVASDEPAPRPPVKHVVVVALAEAGAHEVFGPGTRAPYLARELRAQGALLPDYHALADGDLPNLIAMLSGQADAANPETVAGCPALTPFAATGSPDDGQLAGSGCVLPADLPSLPNQLQTALLPWHAYIAGAEQPDGAPPAPCTPPAPAPDGSPAPLDRDPILFFAAVAPAPDCTARVTGLAPLAADLVKPADAAPAFTLVVPSACDGGREGACPPGEPAGVERTDEWLRQWMPQILASPEFADDGLVVVTFAAGRGEDRRVGALVLSPHVKPATTSRAAYDHLALLRTIEDAFGLDHLGGAGAADLKPFGDDVFATTG